jgi:hypothetical protein
MGSGQVSLFSTDAAGPILVDDSFGTLTIEDVSLNTPAWCLPDMSPLWASRAQRGSNRLIPGVTGRKAYKRRLDETKLSLPILITGFCDSEGTSYADIGISFAQGLEANVKFLQNAFGLDDPALLSSGDSTLTATLTLPSGDSRVADVQVLGLSASFSPVGISRGRSNCST